MALTDENGGMVMPVQPMNYGYPVMGGYGGFGNFGGDLGSLIVLFLIAAMFGGFGGGFGGFGGGWSGDFMFPWLMTGQAGINANTNAGFDNAAIGSQLSAIQSTLASNEVANCNRAIDNLQTAYSNQIADLNRSFDSQTAITAGQNAIQSQLAKCCCDNQLQTESLRATVLQENCQDRYEAQSNARDIIASQVAGTQKILDKLCDQELQAERRENQELRTRLNMADLAASQAQQTAALVADNTAQTQYIVNRVAPYPIPAYPVSNPYGCNGFYGNYGYNNFGFNPFGNVGFGNGSF